MENEVIRHYTNGELTIVWKPAACIHSRNCWNAVTGMPGVFDPRKRPWITMENGQTAAIEAQVAKCPSGALSTYYNEAKTSTGLQPASESLSASKPVVSAQQSVNAATGLQPANENLSASKPVVSAEQSVDAATGLQPPATEPAVLPAEPLVRIRVMPNGPLLVTGCCEVEDVAGNSQVKKDVTAFCRCGYSANKPYCDGSHVREGFQG